MNKTILITGSTDGIGKLAAIKLAKDHHSIIIHGRNANKVKSVVEEIKSQTNNENIDGFTADLSDFDEVNKLSERIATKYKKIDVLVNNAGVYKSPVNQNKNGLNIQFAVNYLAPFILTNKLLPLLENSEDARIINLSSAAQSSISLSALKGVESISTGDAYAQSKLAILMWSFYLAQQHNNISVIALNPGSLLNTNMVREAFGNYWSSADKGANIIYELAVSDKYKGITGKYFDNDKGDFGKAHPDAYDENEILSLIEITKKILADYSL